MAITKANADFAPIRFGPYELLAKLAVGGMAEIFLAREHDADADTGEVFVVKRLLPHIAQHPDLVQMFIDEVRVAATLEHENVVSVYNVGAIGDQYFQSMEYLRGVDLRRICQLYWANRKPIPRSVLLHILISVADGLEYVHSKKDGQGRDLKLIHRDISPHNIFVTTEGVAKILDFGVAKAANALHQTRTGALVGKLSYMSPEQAKTHDLDHRSDLFSFGIVMWEMFAGRRLFRVKDLGEFEVLRRLCEEPIPPPSEVTKGPRDFDRIVARAMAKDREQRYQHAAEISADLKKAADRLNVDASRDAAKRILQRAFAREFEAEVANRERLIAGPKTMQQDPSDQTPVSDPGIIDSKSPADDPFPDLERTQKRDREKEKSSSGTSRRRRHAPVRVPVMIPRPGGDTESFPAQPWPKEKKARTSQTDRRVVLLILTLVLAIGALLVAVLFRE